MDENTYQVIISNTLSDDQDKHLVVEKLASLFKTSEQKAEQLLARPETVVKKNIDKATAEKYQLAISKTGAQCKIVNLADETLPDIMTPVAPPAETEARPFTADIQNSVQQAKLKLEKKEHQQLKNLDNFSEKTFCPECGTIKDSTTAVCLHCGYDPQAPEIKNRKIRKYAVAILILTAVIITAYLVALPFYNLYASKSKIENGLGLAFDTRNKITQFILKTNFWPNQNIDANLPKNISNEIIESIIIGPDSVMTVTLRAEAINSDIRKTILFKPKMLKGKLVWNCTQGTLENDYRPDICKTKIQ